MNMNHKNKKLFQEKFQDFEPELDRDIWAGIEAGIKKRKLPFFSDYRRMAMVAAAVVLIFFVAGIIWERNQLIEENNVVKPSVAKVEKNKNTDNQLVKPKEEIKNNENTQNSASVLVEKEAEPKAKASKTNPFDSTKSKVWEQNLIPTNLEVKVAQVVDKQQDIVVQTNLVEPKKEAKEELVIEKPKLPEMKPIEAMAATKNTPVNDWKTIYVPSKPKLNKEGQVLENVVVAQNKEDLNSLDLSNFNLNNALVFASHKMEKLANKPLNVYHTEDSKQSHWTYIFKLKGFQITRKVHRDLKNKR